MARRLGWSDEQLGDLSSGQISSDFSDREKVALQLAEIVTRDAHGVRDDFFAEVRRHFDEGEVIELLAVIGLFNYFNRFNDALQMESSK